MAAFALGAGVVAGWLAVRGNIALWWPWSTSIPAAAHARFLAAFAAHTASYLAGGLGGLVLIFLVWRQRLREPR
jgi:hypothetical protein